MRHLSAQLRPAVWTDEVAYTLLPALDGADMDDFEQDVKGGGCQLWMCDDCYVVTEEDRVANVLHVWLVGGRNFRRAAHAINNKLHECGYLYARYRTRDVAALRLYRFLKPVLVNSELHEYISWPFH